MSVVIAFYLVFNQIYPYIEISKWLHISVSEACRAPTLYIVHLFFFFFSLYTEVPVIMIIHINNNCEVVKSNEVFFLIYLISKQLL